MDGSRRGFLKGLAAVGALSPLRHIQAQQVLTPATPTISNEAVKRAKVAAMQWHSEHPLTGSVPAHEHDFDVTPTDRMFVRNNHVAPDIDVHSHRLAVTGLTARNLSFSVQQLQASFPVVTMQGMLECAGSGRGAYVPRPGGTPWPETGGMGCPKWTGVRLRDVLRAAGLKARAAHVAAQGADAAMVSTGSPMIRSIPLEKALDAHTLLAWAMNDAPLPQVHGYPLRLVVPGWAGSASIKWLQALTVLERPFTGAYMDANYRVPRWPVEPGQAMPADAVSTEAWPVKSMITYPAPNTRCKRSDRVMVRGRAWVGEGSVERVDVSTDEGRTWHRAALTRSGDKYAWRTFTYEFDPASLGYMTVLARAWDERGNAQPAVACWNPLGYFWNGWQRVGLVIEG